MTSWEF